MIRTLTDVEERTAKLAISYAEASGAFIPDDVIRAALKSGAIKRTKAGNLDNRSFAGFLDESGFALAAATFRRKHGLKPEKQNDQKG